MTESGKGFWHTAPGVITAVAALITAIGGVLAILVQNDIIATSNDGAGQVVAGTPEGGEPGSDQAIAGATGTPVAPGSLIPWTSATATITRKDGTSATVRAPTLGLACATETLAFENGQRVSLDLVRSIVFDVIYVENSSVDGVVTLLDGREMRDPIHTWNCPVTGANELGSLEVQLKDIRRIDFVR